ncbi:uncharacterized protein TNCV_2902281 [Trichonephila clavipes]|nr:uncharacterized protein TNCV_2902281 [Trichonephila clavipes]
MLRYVEAALSAVPQGYIHSLFDSIPCRVAAVITNNGGFTNYGFCRHPHIARSRNFIRWIYVQHVTCQINFPVVLLGVEFCMANGV